MGRNIFGGGTQTDDRGPSGADVGAVSVNDNQFNQWTSVIIGYQPDNDMAVAHQITKWIFYS